MAKKKRRSNNKKGSYRWLLWPVLGVLLFLLGWYFVVHQFGQVLRNQCPYVWVEVGQGATVEALMDSLYQNGYLAHPRLHRLSASEEGEALRPGFYKISRKTRRHQLLAHLKQQAPISSVSLNIPPESGRMTIVKSICKQAKWPIDSVLKYMKDAELAERIGFQDPEALWCIWIPGKVRYPVRLSVREFIIHMGNRFHGRWIREGMAGRNDSGLRPEEVFILASIVTKESRYEPELPDIAGVYMNRLRKGMKLQSDPTVVFAVSRTGVRRVLQSDLQKKSPYNTYKVKGLPPGPIAQPTRPSIEAVLRAADHDYYYFCANPEKPGSHQFAENYTEHLLNARRYQEHLDNKGIRK
jgi:UPF0755 protein